MASTTCLAKVASLASLFWLRSWAVWWASLASLAAYSVLALASVVPESLSLSLGFPMLSVLKKILIEIP